MTQQAKRNAARFLCILAVIIFESYAHTTFLSDLWCTGDVTVTDPLTGYVTVTDALAGDVTVTDLLTGNVIVTDPLTGDVTVTAPLALLLSYCMVM